MVTFGAKANIIYQTGDPTWENIKNGTVEASQDKGKNNVGYNAGISLKLIHLLVFLFNQNCITLLLVKNSQ